MNVSYRILVPVLAVAMLGQTYAKKRKKPSPAKGINYTQIERPTVPDELMQVSVYPEVTVQPSDLPVKMDGPEIDFVAQCQVPTDGQIITPLLQKAIDELAAKGGGKIRIAKGDYQIGNVQLRSNIHLLFEGGTIIRPWSESPAQVSMFSVGSEKGSSGIVRNVSIQGVNGRAIVLLPEEMRSFDTKFSFIRSRYVRDFYYANFIIYDHKTVISSLAFGAADRNSEGFIGPTHGLVMNLTVVDAHYGYGLVQAQAGRDIRFYNLHGIGGITLRLETGAGNMNESQFGGVFDIEGRNISVANGHGGVMCGAHGMSNGVAHIQDVTAFSSGAGFSIGDGLYKSKAGKVYHGSFAKGTSIRNVTATFGLNAQIKTKELWQIPEEYLEQLGKPGKRAIIEPAPSHTCVRISASFPVDYDASTFVAKGFKYGNPVRITKGKIVDEEKQNRFTAYLLKKYNLKTLNSKKML